MLHPCIAGSSDFGSRRPANGRMGFARGRFSRPGAGDRRHMIGFILGIVVAGLTAVIGYALMAAFTDSTFWSFVGAIVAGAVGFGIGTFMKGDETGHGGSRMPD